jgi:hypothetical protein
MVQSELRSPKGNHFLKKLARLRKIFLIKRKVINNALTTVYD